MNLLQSTAFLHTSLCNGIRVRVSVLLQACMSLCLAGDTALDGGLVHSVDPQPGERAPDRDGPEGVSPQGIRVKAGYTHNN